MCHYYRPICCHFYRICCEQVAVTLQRYVRGFVAQKRKKRMRVLNKVVTKLQRTQRMSGHRSRHKRVLQQRKWACCEIQRIVRGFLARVRVQKIVEANFDTGLRQIAYIKKMWLLDRERRAANKIKKLIQKFVRRQKTLRVMRKIFAVDQAHKQMADAAREALEAKLTYRQELEVWYSKRKVEYDREVYIEGQTSDQKKAVLSYRRWCHRCMLLSHVTIKLIYM